jgi:hypothetical protein
VEIVKPSGRDRGQRYEKDEDEVKDEKTHERSPLVITTAQCCYIHRRIDLHMHDLNPTVVGGSKQCPIKVERGSSAAAELLRKNRVDPIRHFIV